jgi:galactose-1-phosphate uridylyltransferase
MAESTQILKTEMSFNTFRMVCLGSRKWTLSAQPLQGKPAADLDNEAGKTANRLRYAFPL